MAEPGKIIWHSNKIDRNYVLHLFDYDLYSFIEKIVL